MTFRVLEMNLEISLKESIGHGFVKVIPSYPAENQQVWVSLKLPPESTVFEEIQSQWESSDREFRRSKEGREGMNWGSVRWAEG